MNKKDFKGIPFVEGGVCAAKGFKANGIHCGIKANGDPNKNDLAMICADKPCTAAAMYTTNKVQGAPIAVTKAHLEDGKAQAVIVNSVNANTCNADGVQKAEAMCEAAANALGLKPEDIIVASTGVIGQPLPLEPIAAGIRSWSRVCPCDGQSAGCQCHHDDRYRAEGGRCLVRDRRQDLPSRRYAQGQRHDPPEHGDDPDLPHDRLRY